MASEDLLKKAVAAFKALSPEQQEEMMEEQRQSWVRGNVGLSRDERDMTSPVMPRPAPAATDTGLVTVLERPYLGSLVARSQAEELLAAERADKEMLEAAWLEAEGIISDLKADNAAQDARINFLERLIKEQETQITNGVALEAKLAAAEKALEPFAEIAGEPWADENGWTDAACQNDRIVDWFGPSAFLAARAALEAKP